MSTEATIETLLTDLGLSSTEKQLYLAGLTLPEASVSWLVSRTGINRTTCYHALSTLKQKGFLLESKLHGKLLYKMTRPEDLSIILKLQQDQLQQQKVQLDRLSPLFPGLSAPDVTSTYIEKFEGIDGIKRAIEKALYCKQREWNIVAPYNNFFSQINKKYANYFMSTRKERGITARTLWEPGADSSSHGLSLETIATRKPRYLSNAFKGAFTSVVIMFDDKILFLPPLREETAILVDSKEVTSTMRVLFDALWLLADKPA